MLRSGVRIGMAIIPVVQFPIHKVRRQGPAAFFVVALGSAARVAAAYPYVTAPTPSAGPMTSVFALLCFPKFKNYFRIFKLRVG